MMTSEGRSVGRRDFPWGLTSAVAVVFALFCGLGVWQVQRMGWKHDLLSRIAALQHAPARPIDQVLAEARTGRDVAYTRVRASCPGLARARFERLHAIRDGAVGERLISACRLSGGGSILVDRGFLPDGARAPVVFEGAGDLTPVEIVGVLRRPDPPSLFTPSHRIGGRWYGRDLPAMARELAAPGSAPYFLASETAINPEDPALIPAPLPLDIPDRHLGYVITWFGLAAALIAVYAALLRQRLRGG